MGLNPAAICCTAFPIAPATTLLYHITTVHAISTAAICVGIVPEYHWLFKPIIASGTNH